MMKVKKTENFIDRDKENTLSVDRREFLKLLGGGIVILFSVGEPSTLLLEAQRRFGRDYPTDFNAYLRIGEDGRISCFAGKAELGQGVITSFAQILAEELDVSLDLVDMVLGDTDICPWDMGTFGSRSIKYFGPPLRQAAAEAKVILLQLASEHLGVPLESLEVTNGTIRDKSNPKKQVTYEQLAQGKRIERHLDKKPPVKHFSEYKISGKSFIRTDSLEKVTGKAKYAGDIHFPDMLYAKILRPPAHGAKLKSVDLSAVQQKKDVRVVKDGDFIAVLHSTPDGAEKALAQIKAQFDVPKATVDDTTIHEHLLRVAPEGEVVAQEGDLAKGGQLASLVFKETYRDSYVAHAPIETHTAVVKIEGNKATVWASTQRPFGAQEEVAQTLGIPSENVRVITPFVGGGFGGKNVNLQAVEAARLAKLSGKTVQVAWSRGEEFFYDTYRPASIIKIQSGLNEQNQIVFWDFNIYYAGERSSQVFYDIPHHRVVSHGGWRGAPGAHPFGTGAWRAPGSNSNIFARESHIDLMASKVGMDPLEFRLKNLTDKRMQNVLKATADKFGWTSLKLPSGRGHGIACLDYLGTYVAAMVEIEIDKEKGTIQVKRVVCAQDMGQIINPEGAKQQIEGCIIMGLGYVLAEETHFKGGQIFDLNFDTYQIARFSWTPKIETVLIDNPEMPAQGGGEPAITCMGGVIANAIYDATGARLLQLPMTAERIKAAMKQS